MMLEQHGHRFRQFLLVSKQCQCHVCGNIVMVFAKRHCFPNCVSVIITLSMLLHVIETFRYLQQQSSSSQYCHCYWTICFSKHAIALYHLSPLSAFLQLFDRHDNIPWLFSRHCHSCCNIVICARTVSTLWLPMTTTSLSQWLERGSSQPHTVVIFFVTTCPSLWPDVVIATRWLHIGL